MNYNDLTCKSDILDRIIQLGNIEKAREKLGKHISEKIYGVMPERPLHLYAEILKQSRCFTGNVTYRNTALKCEMSDSAFTFDIDVLLPRSDMPLPSFIYLNFGSSITDGIPYEELCNSGYAVFMLNVNKVTASSPDFKDGIAEHLVKQRRALNSSGKLTLWAWAAIRVMDYASALKEIDGERITLIGHDILALSALIAGAHDERFGAVIAHQMPTDEIDIIGNKIPGSYSELISSSPHLFCPRAKRDIDGGKAVYSDNAELIAMNFPRQVILGCAADDLISDRHAVFNAMIRADKFYRHFGEVGLDGDSFDEDMQDGVIERGSLVCVIRHGIHSISAADWRSYMDILERKTAVAGVDSLIH